FLLVMDLFTPSGPGSKNSNPHEPLATRMRPQALKEFAGQGHILGEGKLLRRMIESGIIGSLIFYGPPSSGKTTLAHVISKEVKAQFVVLNAVLDGIKDLREVVKKAEDQLKANRGKTILFVDEIHRWNKAQQDALLPHIESGLLTLIGATTENPFYSLVGPLLSRCQLFEMYPFTTEEIDTLIDRAIHDEERGLGKMDIALSDEARGYLSEYAGGDIRNALNALEMAAVTSVPEKSGKRRIDLNVARESIQKRVVRYARSGDEHYHYASAFIKSMRGSDPDASLYWMAAMLEGGEDPIFIFRRMLIFASEDVGLANPQALTMVNSAQEAFVKCGMPEGLYFLSHACLYLTLAPKSNSTSAIFSVISELKEKGVQNVPAHLKDKTANKLQARYLDVENASKDYKYPHSFSDHWVEQDYLPDSLKEKSWYNPGDRGVEKQLWDKLQGIKEKKRTTR
ncbi:MAG: replication-associated recombination protein A, partial [Balneolales bacterium]